MLQGWLGSDKIGLHADHPPALAALAAVEAKLVATKEAGAAYLRLLELSRAEYEKLASLLRPEKWIEAQLAAFAPGGNRGTTSVEVAHLISEHDGPYMKELADKRALVAGVAPHAECAHCGVAEVVKALEDGFRAVDAAAQTYRGELVATQKAFCLLLDIVSRYNSGAIEFLFIVEDLLEELREPVMGSSVAAVETAIAKLESDTQATLNEVIRVYTQLDAWARELLAAAEAGKDEANAAFARYNLSALYERYQAADAAMTARAADLRARLAVEQDTESLRLEFAAGASQLVEYAAETTVLVGQLPGDTLEAQLDALTEMAGPGYAARKARLEALADGPVAKLDARGIIANPHTVETIFSLRATLEAVGEVFTNADEALRGQIMVQNASAQVTAEQYKEIKDVFEFFDENRDANLDKQEFWSCATSLGLMFSETEVDATIAELDTSGDGTLSFDGKYSEHFDFLSRLWRTRALYKLALSCRFSRSFSMTAQSSPRLWSAC